MQPSLYMYIQIESGEFRAIDFNHYTVYMRHRLSLSLSTASLDFTVPCSSRLAATLTTALTKPDLSPMVAKIKVNSSLKTFPSNYD